MKAFIEANFKMIDINGDGVVNKQEFCYNCITRIAVDNVQVVYDAFDSLLNVSYYYFRLKFIIFIINILIQG